MTFRIREKLPVSDEESFRSDRRLVKALALLLMITGLSAMMFYVWFFYVEYPTFSEDVQEAIQSFTVDVMDKVLLIVAGFLLYRRRETIPLYRAVAWVSIVLGVYLLSNMTPVMQGLDLFDYLIQVTSIVLMFGLVVFGVLLLAERYKYTSALGFISLFYVAYEILTIRFDILLMSEGLEILSYVVPFVPYTVLMFTFCYSCFRRSVMPASLVKRMTDSGNRIIDTGYTEEESYMLRSDLIDMLSLFDAPAETADGIAEIERRYRIITPLRSRLMTVRRWKGEDFLRAVVGSESGSFSGFRFQIHRVFPDTGSPEDCELITIYGEPGMLVRLCVRDKEVTYQELSAIEFEEDRKRYASPRKRPADPADGGTDASGTERPDA